MNLYSFSFIILNLLINFNKLIHIVFYYKNFQKINDMWEMVKYMSELPPFPSGEDPICVRNSQICIESLVKQAKNYLEARYKTYMQNIINDNLKVAERGGTPGTFPLVRSFVGIRLQGEYAGLVDGYSEERPLWAMVYYCLRSGDYEAAAMCIKKST